MDHVFQDIFREKRKNKTKKHSYKSLKCHPRQYTSKRVSSKSCLDNRHLRLMTEIWNRRYPHNKIRTKNSEKIWKIFNNYFSSVCSNEICWINQTVKDNNIKKSLTNKLFAPYSPKSWNHNKNEWLSSIDITNVMKQYEETFDDFKFFGPSPIDFDSLMYEGYCVWPEICNINVVDLYNKGITKIGFIFNTDTHDKGGSHWIAMFVDLNKKYCFFFDSNGTTEPSEITRLKERIINQCHQHLNLKIKSDMNHPFVHQKSNTECGMYCLYFIISLLKKRHNKQYFKKKRITDQSVEKLRNIYFNSSM